MLTIGGTTLEVLVGSITAAPAEAVVNAANSDLWMGGGVAGALKTAGGQEIEREAMAQGPIEPGTAVATRAGQLPPPIRWVIHAATMSGRDLRTSADLIERATTSALRVAGSLGAHSIALPAMGTGVGGFPMDEAARIMVGAVVRHARQPRNSGHTGHAAHAGAGPRPARIIFVVREDAALEAFRSALADFGTDS